MERLLVEAEKCAGCRQCEMVCSFWHEEKFSPTLSRVTVIKVDEKGVDYPVFCRQCPTCPPEEACPTDAFKRTPEGVVDVDDDACNGCGQCVAACGFAAVKLNLESKPVVCDLCGGSPICVERCPTGAILYEEAGFFDETPDEAFSRLLGRWGIG